MIPSGSHAWLVLGFAFALLSVGRWVLQPAAWLAPIFFLHFLRGAPGSAAWLWVWAALFVAGLVANRGVVPIRGPAYALAIAAMATPFALPYLADRLLASHVGGFASTLVFAVALALADHLNTRFGMYASWGSPAYTQYGDLPLVQVASVAGIHGITFLIGWTGSVAAWAWDHGFAWGTVGAGLTTFVAIVLAVLLLGAARLQWWRPRRQGDGAGARARGEGAATPAGPRSVRVAGIVYPTRVVEGTEVLPVLQGRVTGAEREAIRARMREAQEWFLESSAREARAGAQLVVWPEADCLVMKEDEPAFLERMRAAAADLRVHLVAAMAVIEPGAARPFENRASLIDPDGRVHLTYRKTHPVPGWEASSLVRGDRRLGIADTALGRIAVAICYDADFPSLIRQAGRARADLLVVPANDWPAIKHLHWRMATFRAVENGLALVRVTKSGISGAVDACGRVLAVVDETSPGAPALLAEVDLP